MLNQELSTCYFNSGESPNYLDLLTRLNSQSAQGAFCHIARENVFQVFYVIANLTDLNPVDPSPFRERIYLNVLLPSYKILMSGEMEVPFSLQFMSPGDATTVMVQFAEYFSTEDISGISPSFGREVLVTGMGTRLRDRDDISSPLLLKFEA